MFRKHIQRATILSGKQIHVARNDDKTHESADMTPVVVAVSSYLHMDPKMPLSAKKAMGKNL